MMSRVRKSYGYKSWLYKKMERVCQAKKTQMYEQSDKRYGVLEGLNSAVMGRGPAVAGIMNPCQEVSKQGF